MSRTMRRIQIWMMAVILFLFLLAACAPPAAPQDPALIVQAVQESVAMTVAARYAQATEQAANAALPPIGQPEGSQDVPVITASMTATVEFVSELPDIEDNTTLTVEPGVGSPDGTDEATSEEDEDWSYCLNFLQSTLQVDEDKITNPPLSTQLQVGNTAVIQRNVNLRTRPNLRSRILLTLTRDTQVEIIEGPVETPVETMYENGTKYIWWRVQLPDGLTGWSAEMSICRQFYFMEPLK